MKPNLSKSGKWVLIIIILSLSLKFVHLYKYSIPFTYDQGRDLLEVREIWLLKKLRLIGPTTSLHGVFCGPFWYWIIVPFFLISRGNPLSALGPLWLLSVVISIAFWILLSDKKYGLLFVSAFSLSSPFLLASNHALNSHPMIYLYPLILLLVVKYLSSQKKHHLFWIFFLISSGFHFNVPVAAFLFLAISIILVVFKKKLTDSHAIKSLLGFLIPLLPQLLFEIRHNFLQTKTIIKLLSGDTGSLSLSEGGYLDRLVERLTIIGDIFQLNQGLDYRLWSLFFLTFVLLTALSIKKKNRPIQEIDYLFFVSFFSNLAILTCVLIVPFAIWPWYISSIQAGVIFLFLSAVYWQMKNNQFFSKVIPLFFFAWLIWGCFNLELYPPRPVTPTDPSNLKLRLNVIDKIYQDSQGQGMNVFTFAPNVYDYPYQYLIWYQAKEKYGYLPEKYSYLLNQPEYVPAKESADTLLKTLPAVETYLIIEPFESQEKWFLEWRSNFGKEETAWEVGKTRIEKIHLEHITH